MTWSIPDSKEFLGRFYAPIGANQLTNIMQSGFDLVEVLRVGVQKMNHLRNREFRIRDGEFRPDSKVQYRGSWYYISATDLNSRTTFTLLSALFASVVGQVPGAKPVLTLQVN